CSLGSSHDSRRIFTTSICSSAACRLPFHFPPFFLPPFDFLGLPFGHPPPKTFLALLAFEKCSGPCNASVRAPPFLPMALAAALRGRGLFGFQSYFILQTIDVCQVGESACPQTRPPQLRPCG